MSTHFSGKTVLITGASSGIGKALSHLLAQQGANLILVARTMDALNQLKHELDSATNIKLYPLDISDEHAVKTLASNIDISGVDVLVNNAGIACCDRLENLSETDYRDMINTNYLGQVWMTRAILPGMRSRNRGQIINIASMAGVIGITGYSAYSASKYALVGFTESLRNELSATGIKVSLVLPSDIDTPQLAKENQTKPDATKALSGNIKALTPEAAAQKIVEGIIRQKQIIAVSPLSGRFALFVHRIFPGLSKGWMDKIVKNSSKSGLN